MRALRKRTWNLLSFVTVRPRFTQPAKMRKRVIARPVGSSVRLKCTASGNPRPDIVWLKDSRPLTPEEVGESRKKKWTLSLKNLTPEHSGKYTCHVSNRAGEINATYKVEVIRKSSSSSSPFCVCLRMCRTWRVSLTELAGKRCLVNVQYLLFICLSGSETKGVLKTWLSSQQIDVFCHLNWEHKNELSIKWCNGVFDKRVMNLDCYIAVYAE